MNPILEKLQSYGVDIEATMERFVNDENLYVECLYEFLEDNSFMRLKAAISEKRYKDAFDISHMLKGVAGNLGLSSLYYSLCAFVEVLRVNEHSDIEPLYNNIMNEYNVVKSTIAS